METYAEILDAFLIKTMIKLTRKYKLIRKKQIHIYKNRENQISEPNKNKYTCPKYAHFSMHLKITINLNY